MEFVYYYFGIHIPCIFRACYFSREGFLLSNFKSSSGGDDSHVAQD